MNLADEGQNKETILLSLQFIKEEFNEVRNAIGKINERLISLPSNAMSTAVHKQFKLLILHLNLRTAFILLLTQITIKKIMILL